MNTALKITDIEIEKLYTVTEVAKLMHLHVATIRRYIKSGELLAFKGGGKDWRISESELKKFYNYYLNMK